LPDRRNSELLLLMFAAAVTTVALLIVAANQQQRIGWELARLSAAYLALFAAAHLVIRRFAPYADPLLLPVVAVLNGLGLVMIYRLDLADSGLTSGGACGPSAYHQMLLTLVGVVAFCLTVIFVKDHRVLACYGYICGAAGLVLLAIPALLPSSLSEQNGAKIWIRLHVRVGCTTGRIRSPTPTAPATRWCNRCSASPPAAFLAPVWATSSQAPFPSRRRISSWPHSAKKSA
jgi:cell division protein FtsW